MTDTIKAHLDDCKQVSQIVDNANALLTKSQRELMYSRQVLEMLVKYQHPEMSVPTPHMSWLTDRERLIPADVIGRQIARINALLGDRA